MEENLQASLCEPFHVGTNNSGLFYLGEATMANNLEQLYTGKRKMG